jgi:hypothetical protein
MKPSNNTARTWLIENHYEDVAALIDKVVDGWKAKGTHTRRNWWEVLAGDIKGNPRHIEGVTFPVLRAARLRQNLEITEGCLCRNKKEIIPQIVKQVRWVGKK